MEDVSEEQASLQRQTTMTQALLKLPAHEALGVACSFILQIAHSPEHRVMFRRVMNEKVIRNGFGGESLLKVINRHAR